MDSQHKNRSNYFGKAFFAILFFLLVYASSVNINHSDSCNSPYKFASELKTNATAVIVEAEQFHFQNGLLPTIINKANFKLYNYEGLKLIWDNKTIHQQLIFLQRDDFLISPGILQRLLRQYHCKDADDFLI